MIKDTAIMKAVSKIRRRAERQQSIDMLLATFVDIGILPRLLNANNQIIYGRRGTGKTHLLKVLESSLRADDKNVILYIDARILGSSSQFTDQSIPIKQRCSALFQDVLSEIHNGIFTYITGSSNPDKPFEELSQFSTIITETLKKRKAGQLIERKLKKRSLQASLDAKISTDEAALKASIGNQENGEIEQTVTYEVTEENKVIFPELRDKLNSVLTKADATLYVLFDEWSSIPLDIQPYLAEFFRRAFLPNPKIVVKIASLEYRSNFCIKNNGSLLGFELGADIAVSFDIDDYYVYDRNPEIITNNFIEILFKHLASELSEGYLSSQCAVVSVEDFVTKIVTNKSVLIELVRASEGVIRDLINIFANAFFDSRRRDRDKIDKTSVIEAARQWFEQDKSRNLDDQLNNVLRKIIDEVIGNKKAKSFLIPRSLESNKIIQKLFDSRVLHLMKRGYADKDNPGVRYNIYTLDYGTYVDLINTTKQPQLELEPENKHANSDDIIVPFDDKRSIRRIILTEEMLASN